MLAARTDFQHLFLTGDEEARARLLARKPDVLLGAALREYRARGNQDRLDLAAALIDEVGAKAGHGRTTDNRAADALSSFVEYASDVTGAFVDVIVRAEWLGPSEREAILWAIVRGNSGNAKWRLAAVLGERNGSLGTELLTALSSDNDENVAAAAEEALQSR